MNFVVECTMYRKAVIMHEKHGQLSFRGLGNVVALNIRIFSGLLYFILCFLINKKPSLKDLPTMLPSLSKMFIDISFLTT